MLPVVAIVGRPNVGKSTLFNALTRTRDALVADQPGLTRDRKYGEGKLGRGGYIVVDTGGLTDEQGAIDDAMAAERAAFNRCFTTEDAKTGILAFIAKEQPEFVGR